MLGIAEASTQLIICRDGSSWLLTALLPSEDRDCDSLQGAGVWSSLMHTEPAPPCHCGQGAWGEGQGGGGQADGADSGGGLNLQYVNKLVSYVRLETLTSLSNLRIAISW